MAIFKCKMCGGTLEISDNSSVAVCEYCGTQQTLPRVSDDVVANLFNRANNLRIKSEFDKAQEIYEKIISGGSTDSEAYWGAVLCKFGIEYVEDPTSLKRIPTCHRTQVESVLADVDYIAAIQNADASQKSLYEAESTEIDRLQKDILKIAGDEKPFDVFLCYKESDENGKRTADSVIANDIYHQLTQEGFKVFYAAITLEEKLGQEYEPYIFAALNSSKVMLALGTKPEYFNAVWVRNEWSRYLKIIKNDRSKLLIPCYKNMDAYDLPEEFSHLQAQDMGKIGFVNDVIRGIRKVVSDSTPKATVKETVVVNNSSASTANIAPLLERAFMFLEDGDWAKADNFCEQVLNQNPKCAEAYLGKLMAEMQCHKQDDLKNCAMPFDGSSNYAKAVRFGDEKLKNELQGYIPYVNENIENARLTMLYNDALQRMNTAKTERDYMTVAELFKQISGFRDSDAKAEKYTKKAEEVRKVTEKARKRARWIRIITLAVAVVTITFAIALTTVIIPKQKLNKAMAMIDSGDYYAAYALLYELGDDDVVYQSKYDRAVALIDAGDYVPAYELLVELNYKDSAEKADTIFSQYKQRKLKTADIGDYAYLGTYEQDDNTANGKEDVEWLVLDKQEGKILLISRYCLACRPYHSTYANTTWKNCTLRKWLNGEFINNAFSSEEQALILDSKTTNPNNEVHGTDGGNDTTDKAFLLSYSEAKKYFASDEARRAASTAYAVEQGARTNDDYTTASGEATSNWWLRTPGSDSYSACNVYSGGSVSSYYYVNDTSIAVRPAMWVSFDS